MVIRKVICVINRIELHYSGLKYKIVLLNFNKKSASQPYIKKSSWGCIITRLELRNSCLKHQIFMNELKHDKNLSLAIRV